MNEIEKLLYPKYGEQKNIFFSGKGGVGKTSMACITAVHTAIKGYKTLLITTDPASHIGNVLEVNVTDEVTEIEGISNLYAVKIDPKKVTDNYKKAVIEDAKSKFNETTVKAMEEELNSPCTEEMSVFQKFIEYIIQTDYDVVVFDTAPTGHTLRLLELPMNWNKQIELKAGVSHGMSDEDKKQKERFEKAIDIMKNKNITTFSFVMYPEKTPIIEAYRASQELETFGISTQLAVANLIIPEEQAITQFFKNRRDMQLKYIDEINERFKNSYLIKVPMAEKEIKGLTILSNLANTIFGWCYRV